MARQKKLVLVFPPLATPTSPPLGPAMLKAFIQRELPQWQVKLLDLNLWTFQRIFALMGAGKLPLDAKVFPEGDAARAGLLTAAKVFRGQGDGDDFYRRPERYELYGDLFLRLTEMFSRGLVGYCASHRPPTPLPPLLQEMLDKIMAEEPDCVGFSMIFTPQLAMAALLGKTLRQRFGTKVVMGGSCLADTAEDFVRWYPQAADAIVTGEGEDALKALLDKLDSPPPNGATRIIPAMIRDDLDTLGRPDFGDLNLHDYFSPEPVIPVLLSRGCYWRRCAFCVHYRSAGLSYRMHGKQFIIDMLKHFPPRACGILPSSTKCCPPNTCSGGPGRLSRPNSISPGMP